MDTLSVLSRRSLLKASSYLAVAVVAAPASVAAAPAVPAVLTALLSEYAAAAEAVKITNERFNEARRAKSKAIDEARMYFVWPNGSLGRIGEYGNSYHPEYALALLERDRPKYLAEWAGNHEMLAEVRKEFAAVRRKLRALNRRYDAIVAGTDWQAASDADTEAYQRFSDARAAVCAYRPATMTEVAALIRCLSDVGPWPGTHNGVSVRDLADMLDGGVAS